VVIATASGEVVIAVEIAETPERRAQGLSGRRALPENSGMLFLYETEVERSFHMRDVSIPLSIAFVDDAGRVLRIIDMDPCLVDPCPLYSPGVRFRAALEVNGGAFRRWGVTEGDRMRLYRSPNDAAPNPLTLRRGSSGSALHTASISSPSAQ
jgi:uncharacterized membrane protein (UPF0127 family)